MGNRYVDLNLLAKEEISSIDLHGYTVEEAEVVLFEHLETLPKSARAVEVAHGYSRGTALKRMVKEEFYHWRIDEKRVGLNPGATWFLLKNK